MTFNWYLRYFKNYYGIQGTSMVLKTKTHDVQWYNHDSRFLDMYNDDTIFWDIHHDDSMFFRTCTIMILFLW